MAQFQVHNLIIVDASGSMSAIYNQALAGINETLSTIRKEAKKSDDIKQTVTLLSFASGGEPLQYAYHNTFAEQTSPLTPDSYRLRGATALHDAIGQSVTELERSVGKKDKVLVTIITDGYENDSREWNGATVRQLIERLRHNGWVFTYIGANQDAALEASNIGVINSLQFEATVEGTIDMFACENRSRERWNERVRLNEGNIESAYFTDDEPQNRVTPERISQLAPNEVFVFGSNIQGNHSGGAAKAAFLKFGAQPGIGEGPQGQSYAIPTVGCPKYTTQRAVRNFIRYARLHPERHFLVTPVGCGNGGWDIAEMAKLFYQAKHTPNISLPQSFWDCLG